MVSSSRWLVAFCAAAALAVSVVPTGSALPINGAIFWRDSAEVHGLLAVDPKSSTIIAQSLAPHTEHGEYAWSMTADLLQMSVVSHEEQRRVHGYSVVGRAGDGWHNETYSFRDARVLVELTPSRDFGASSVIRTADGGSSEVRMVPLDGAPAFVRSVDPHGEVMTVPSSAYSSDSNVYEYHAPAGHLLEVTGPMMTHAQGALQSAFFGWRLTVSTPDQGILTFRTGVEKVRDPTTGIQTGTVLRFLTFTADGAFLTLPAFEGKSKVYTPILHYKGHSEFPSGLYQGRHQDLAPQNQERMPLDGSIILGAVGENPYEQNYVHAWGDAEWVEKVAVIAAPAPVPVDPLPVLVAMGGLFLGTQLVPGLLRGLRMGAFLLYARLREQNVNANPTRERIFEAIKVEPGLNLSRMVNDLDIGWGTAAYHVQILKRQNRVKELRFLNRVCFFAAEGSQDATQVQTVLLRQPNYREVMTVLEAQPGLSQREVAVKTGHARQYISRLVAKMERAGLLRAEPSRTGRKYFPHQGGPVPDVAPIATFVSTPRPVAAPPAPPAPTPATVPTINAASNPY